VVVFAPVAFVELCAPETDGSGVVVTAARVNEDDDAATSLVVLSEEVAVDAALGDSSASDTADDGGTVLEVIGGIQTDVVTVVGWSLSVQVAVVCV
jgi:hypothetical protein